MSTSQQSSILHVHAPYSPRGPAAVIGTRAALTALREAIDQALASGSSRLKAVAADGAVYTVGVQCDDTAREGPVWPLRASPYVAPYAEERRVHAIWPEVLST